MSGIWILTMVFMVSSTSQNRAMTSIVVEYSSKDACEFAKSLNRDAISGGVLLATCTKK